MKKLSQHDEREIKDYVKFNPHSLGERVMPGHKRRKTEISHQRDNRGVEVSYKATNYLRSKSKALSKAKK
jgi:hypothetical protein